MDKYKIVISEKAYSMLGNHIRFLSNVNREAAKKLKLRVMESIRSLEKMPERFPFINVEFIPLNKYHKIYVDNWFLILFQIKDNTIFVDYIVDCRQDYQWLIL